MPIQSFAVHPYTSSNPTAAAFYSHAVYYEAPRSVKRFSIEVVLQREEYLIPTVPQVETRLPYYDASGCAIV
jgi:hypothetical protein